jgi:hypothetical protein
MGLYGFMRLKDLANERVTSGDNIALVTRAIDESVAAYNEQINRVIRFFAEPTTDYTARFAQGTANRLQPLDDDGRARPVKPSGYYDVAFPLWQGGTAWGANYVTLNKMTIAEAERITQMMLVGDATSMRTWMLGALFMASDLTYTDPLKGALTIKPIANGDSVTYPRINGGTAATADHILAEADAIADAANPYTTIYSSLTAHPDNRGDVVAFIPTNLVATTKALATFFEVEDPNIRQGADTAVLVGGGPTGMPGTLIGRVSNVWIVEWTMLPDGYIIATTTEGPRPLAMRQDPEPELQGFKQVATRDDHPFYERQYLRRAGFAAYNRVGALVYYVGASDTYAVPTGYALPPV